MRIHLLGFMAAGKTRLAAVIAELGGLPWLDLDAEIERRSGMSIPALFAYAGEAAFRREEQAALAALADRDDLVLATGGGVVATAANHPLLAAGYCVYLDWEWPLLAARLAARPGQRPLAVEGEAALRARWEQRDPSYRALAQLVLPLGSADDAEPPRRLREALAHRILAAARAAAGPCE
jgi:shikimate kinase